MCQMKASRALSSWRMLNVWDIEKRARPGVIRLDAGIYKRLR